MGAKSVPPTNRITRLRGALVTNVDPRRQQLKLPSSGFSWVNPPITSGRVKRSYLALSDTAAHGIPDFGWFVRPERRNERRRGNWWAV